MAHGSSVSLQCVLDFRSLYPSVVIAYNMCYSTCLGKTSGTNVLGISSIDRERGLLKAALDGNAFATPNGVMFMNPKVSKFSIPELSIRLFFMLRRRTGDWCAPNVRPILIRSSSFELRRYVLAFC